MTTSLPGYVALALLTVLTLSAIVRPQPGAWWQGRASFGVLLGLTIITAHAPTLNFRQELTNPDESQLLAGALTLRQSFAPWRSVDLSTAGPVSVLPLLIIPASFPGARWCAALCSTFTILLSWLALTGVRDNRLARIVALPVATFFVFMQGIELFQFSTEHMAVLLLAAAACIWLTTTAGGETPLRARPALALGFCLGAAVMAKLQSAPCAAWLAATLGGLVLIDGRVAGPRRAAVFALLATGSLGIPLCFVALAAAQGVLPDMVHSYWLNNLHYVSSMEGGATGYQPSLVWGLNYLLKPVGVILLGCFFTLRSFSPAERRTAFVTVGLLASAIFAVVIPGRGFGHYWLFVLGPVLLSLGAGLAPAWRWFAALRPDSPALQRWAMTGLVPLLLVLPVAHRLKSSRDEALAAQIAGIRPVQTAGERLHALANPGDALTVWGWRPELHAYSGLPQGTRDAHTQWQIQAIPQRDYYRRRFLHDLAVTRPRFIADAVGPRGFAFTERAKAGHEVFPAFQKLIERDYDYLGETDGIRLYSRHAN